MKYTPTAKLFTVEIDGNPIVSFEAINYREANELLKEEWFREDLCELRSGGEPLWDGKANLRSRPANEAEAGCRLASFSLPIRSSSNSAADVRTWISPDEAAIRGINVSAVTTMSQPLRLQLLLLLIDPLPLLGVCSGGGCRNGGS